MNVGELFISLGIKGSDKTLGAISGVKKGLKDVASTSLETKAALIGAMYALERLFAASGQQGTNLTNFNALLGVSAKTLQQYQYAARQVGVSNEEVEGSFKALQNSMAKTFLGEGAPKGLGRLSQVLGKNITRSDIEQFMKSPQELIQLLQQYAGKESNQGLRNEVLKSFGLGDNMIAALSRRAFTPATLGKAPTYSDGEIKQLNKADVAWSNLDTKIKMAVGHFNAKHGVTLANDISQVVDKVLKLLEAFEKLAEKLKLFQAIGKIFEGWTEIFDGLTEGVTEFSDGLDDHEKAQGLSDKITGGIGDFLKGVAISLGLDDIQVQKSKPDLKLVPHPSPTAKAASPAAVPPGLRPTAQAGAGATNNVTVNQNLNFQHEGKDAKRTGDSTKQAASQVFRQYGAQGQAN